MQPRAIVCLGATAAQSLLGAAFRISAHRGEALQLPADLGLQIRPGPVVAVTIHPSAVLRDRSENRDEAYRSLVDDLRSAGGAGSERASAQHG